MQGVGESDAVHFELVPDVLCDIAQRATFKPVNGVPAHMSTGPIAAGKFDPPAGGVDYFHVVGGEGKLDVFNVEEGGFLSEVAFEGAASGHENFVNGSIGCVTHIV